jgi:hypothetical protein
MVLGESGWLDRIKSMLDFHGYVIDYYFDLISVSLDDFLLAYPLFCLHHMAGSQMMIQTGYLNPLAYVAYAYAGLV